MCIIRKGLLRALGKHFLSLSCKVEIMTAFSGEEMVRLVDRHSFDLVVSDHSFSTCTEVTRIEEESEDEIEARPVLKLDCNYSSGSLQEACNIFFANERFSVKDGDGCIGGLNAIRGIIESTADNGKCCPLFILSSGHSFSVDLPGVVVVQKPFVLADAIVAMGGHLPRILRERPGQYTVQKSSSMDNSYTGDGHDDRQGAFNKRGNQMFEQFMRE